MDVLRAHVLWTGLCCCFKICNLIQKVSIFKKYIQVLFPHRTVRFSLVSGNHAALFSPSCSWHQDYHKRSKSVKPALICTQLHPINLKVAIKKRKLLLFFYWNLLAKRERPFNFIASRTLKYSLRSTFCFQPLCGGQDSWHLCMLLLFMMLFSLQMCSASDPSIPSDRFYWHDPSYGSVQKSRAQSANEHFWSCKESLLCPNYGPISNYVGTFCCCWKCLRNKLNREQNTIRASMYVLQTETRACLCTRFVGLSGYSCE